MRVLFLLISLKHSLQVSKMVGILLISQNIARVGVRGAAGRKCRRRAWRAMWVWEVRRGLEAWVVIGSPPPHFDT